MTTASCCLYTNVSTAKHNKRMSTVYILVVCYLFVLFVFFSFAITCAEQKLTILYFIT